MTGWWMVAGASVVGLALIGWARRRARGVVRLDEALPTCAIGDLEEGRFEVTGRIVPIETSPSAVDRAACVYIERAEYRTVGTGLLPVLREVEHGAVCHPFYLEDESGRLLVDPATTLIECSVQQGDGGLLTERRLRAGEEVVLRATFASVADVAAPADGPYRAGARTWTPVGDAAGPPRLSHRTMDGMLRLPDEVSGFLGGAGAILIFVGMMMAFVITFMM